MPIEERDHLHLTIGRRLLADTDDTDLEEQIFNIVTHYNQGANLLTDPAEKLGLGRLNLVAGRKARLAAAFAASATYLKQGLILLDESAWQDHYDLTLDVHSELIEVCNLNIQYEEVEALFEAITENAKQDADAGVAHKVLIISFVARHELSRVVRLGPNGEQGEAGGDGDSDGDYHTGVNVCTRAAPIVQLHDVESHQPVR